MTKIGLLHAYLQNLNLVAAEQIESWVDDWKNIPCWRPHNVEDQFVVAEERYTGYFHIDNYPHGRISEKVLVAHISTWLIDNDSERRDPYEFPIIADVHDTETAHLQFSVAFNELVIAVQDDQGDLLHDDLAYRIL